MKSPQQFKLLTETSEYPAGTMFTFEEKHKFMASLPWQMTRDIVWETVDAKELMH